MSGHKPVKERAAADAVLCIHLESEEKKERKRMYIFYPLPCYFAKKSIFVGHTLLLSLSRAQLWPVKN